jgi:flagella basal body P-ring formation protein FlgA
MRKLIVIWLACLIAPALTGLSSSPALAQAFENLDRIDSIVATTVGAQIGQQGGAVAPVDRRLRLAACPQIPTVEGPVFGAAIVRCDRLGWRIRVPLKAAAPAASAYHGAQPASQRVVMVKKGDPVILVAGDATFTVTRNMVADEDGAVGELIQVRADKNSPPVTGRVEADGIIRIPAI